MNHAPPRRKPAQPDRTGELEARGSLDAFTCTRCGSPCACREKATGQCTDCVLELRRAG